MQTEEDLIFCFNVHQKNVAILLLLCACLLLQVNLKLLNLLALKSQKLFIPHLCYYFAIKFEVICSLCCTIKMFEVYKEQKWYKRNESDSIDDFFKNFLFLNFLFGPTYLFPFISNTNCQFNFISVTSCGIIVQMVCMTKNGIQLWDACQPPTALPQSNNLCGILYPTGKAIEITHH